MRKKMKLIQGNESAQKKVKLVVAKMQGPSSFEVEYLRQMKEELEIFLRAKNFNTINKFDIVFTGNDYTGLMKIHA